MGHTEARWWASLSFRVILAILGLALAYGLASAAPAQLSDCSQTVGTTSAAVVFPASGATGPPNPTTYLEICDAHATNKLGVNATGGTAALGAKGTVPLNSGGCMWWDQATIPVSVSVIGAGANTTTACFYK